MKGTEETLHINVRAMSHSVLLTIQGYSSKSHQFVGILPRGHPFALKSITTMEPASMELASWEATCVYGSLGPMGPNPHALNLQRLAWHQLARQQCQGLSHVWQRWQTANFASPVRTYPLVVKIRGYSTTKYDWEDAKWLGQDFWAVIFARILNLILSKDHCRRVHYGLISKLLLPYADLRLDQGHCLHWMIYKHSELEEFMVCKAIREVQIEVEITSIEVGLCEVTCEQNVRVPQAADSHFCFSTKMRVRPTVLIQWLSDRLLVELRREERFTETELARTFGKWRLKRCQTLMTQVKDMAVASFIPWGNVRRAIMAADGNDDDDNEENDDDDDNQQNDRAVRPRLNN